MIAVVLAALKVGVSHSLANPDTGLAGLEKQEKVDWLLIGASHVQTGYDIERLKKETGLNFYALWYPGLNPAEIDVLYDEVRRRYGKKICRVMVDINSSLMSTQPEIRESDFFYEMPFGVKERLLSIYSDYPRGIGELLEMIFSARTSEIVLRLVTGQRNPPQEIVLHDMTEKDWKELSSAKLRSPRYSSVFARYMGKTSLKLARDYPGHAWFTETALPGFRYQDKENLALKAETKAIIDGNGKQPYLDFGTSGFPVEDRTYFSDQHHLSPKGRDFNTDIFLRELVMPEIEKDKASKDGCLP
jgi:hypothetical protein